MTDIYEQHAAAFSRTSAYVILKKGEKVATIAIRYPADGAGRLYTYVHWLGLEMVRGFAGGYGYDKRTAAACDAARKLTDPKMTDGRPLPMANNYRDFLAALQSDNGYEWNQKLERAGFTVLQAV